MTNDTLLALDAYWRGANYLTERRHQCRLA
jgi:hypothetical protein